MSLVHLPVLGLEGVLARGVELLPAMRLAEEQFPSKARKHWVQSLCKILIVVSTILVASDAGLDALEDHVARGFELVEFAKETLSLPRARHRSIAGFAGRRIG